MKFAKQAVLYWVSTVSVALLLGCAGVLFLFRLDGSMKVIQHLGYPRYFAPLLGVARLAGAAAILLPVPKGAREWAYAGLTFDIVIVIVSILASGLPALAIVQPAIILGVLQCSYLCWRKRKRQS
ncbi:MAG TPA: DoxX family protein [Polyangiaceae bacterium]|nr:DoxX family protein [Polyangiaceae bacterium]